MDQAKPNADAASIVATQFAGEPVVFCERFTTGLRNWVYDIGLESGGRLAVRMCDPAHRNELGAGVAWARRLHRVGVPVAGVLHHDLEATLPFTILERLPGTDLGNVFDELSGSQLEAIAHAVARWQLDATELEPARGYGFALSYDEPLHSSWTQAVHAHIDRSQTWIRTAGIVDPRLAGKVRAMVDRFDTSLGRTQPLPYLHDATTKNVIVSEGVAVGLVDVDQMGFGDPLFLPALTRMSLIAAERSPDYAMALATAVQADHEPGLFDLYTAMHCLAFIGELGQQFNNDTVPTIDHEYRHRLESALAGLLAT
jgi:hypothetical protein